MSVKRYSRQEIYDVTYQAAGDECLPGPSENGEFVLYSDYARLKAEVEKLDTLCKQLMAQHSDISCENIMLRKAGDEMAHKLENYGNYYLTSQWEDAKEGKPNA